MILDVVPPTIISLISVKKCNKVISYTGNSIFFVIHTHSKKKVATTYVASTRSLSLQQNQVERITKDYRYIFSSLIEVPMHYQVKHPIDITPSAPMPNGPVYRHSLMENEKIKCQIQVMLQKWHIKPNSSLCRRSIVLVQNKDRTW
jgi:hypothetical protein